MDEVYDLVEKCAAAAKASRPADLTVLAQLHADLETIASLTADLPAVAAAAQDAARHVEKVVRGQSQDSEKDLRQIPFAIARLRSIIRAQPRSDFRPSTPPCLAEAVVERRFADHELPRVQLFVMEATGLLNCAEASLRKLEQDPADLAEIDAAIRAFHSIHGVAGFLELKQIRALAVAAETLLDRARRGKTPLDADRFGTVLEARDMMKRLVGDVDPAARENRPPTKACGLATLLNRLTDSHE